MERHEEDKKSLINHLKRIEGQVRGIQNMVDSDKYCIDILTQIAAIEGSLKKVSLELLEEHTNHCVKNAIVKGDGEKEIEELLEVFKRFKK